MNTPTIVTLAIAAALLLLAVLLPENKREPDRFFGLRLRKAHQDGGETVQRAARMQRVMTAARALVSRSDDGDEVADAADILPQSTSDDEMNIDDDGVHLGDVVPIGKPAESDTAPMTTGAAAPADAIPPHAPESVHQVEQRFDDGMTSTPVSVAEPSVAPEAMMPQAPAASVPEIQPAAEPLEQSSKNGEELAAGAGAPVELTASMSSASTLQSEVTVSDEQPRRDAITGRDGRRIVWPRLLGLDSASLSMPERLGIVATLGAIGEDYVAPILCEVLEQEAEPTIRDAALEAIRDARLHEAVYVLEASMSASRDRERVLTVEALAAIGADDLLRSALEDPCVAVITAAAAALRRHKAISEDELQEQIAERDDADHVNQLLELIS